MNDNPLLGHASLTINSIECLDDNSLIKRVDQVKTPMTKIREILIGYELFEELHAKCEVCLLNPDKYGNMKRCLR